MFKVKYVIRPNDSLWKLSRALHTSVESIMELNPGIDPMNLQVGQVITVLAGDEFPFEFPFEIPIQRPTGSTEPVQSRPPSNMFPSNSTPSNMIQPRSSVPPSNSMPPVNMPPNSSMPPINMMPPSSSMPPINMPPNINQECIPVELVDLILQFRMLWEQHIVWTKIALEGILNNQPWAEYATGRLLENPYDMANIFRSFYGDNIANEFAKLFTEHLTLAGELAKALMSKHKDEAEKINKKWHDNANKISEFLASINPYWYEDDWMSMMEEHLNLIRESMDNTLEKKYAENIINFDRMEMQALEMADVMAEGINIQF